MWDSLFLNGHLMTVVDEGDYGIIRNGAIAIKGKEIAWLGFENELPGEPQQLAKVVHDLKGAWLSPGLIDCHTHLVYAGNRANEFNERLAGRSYEEIAKAGGGIRQTVAATRAASEDELYQQSVPRLQSLLNEGVTTVEIKSGYGLDVENEIKMLTVARRLAKDFPLTIKTTFLGAHAIPEEFSNRSDDYITLVCNEMLAAINKQKLADSVDVFCENIAFNREQCERVFKAAQQFNLPVKIHAEQLSNQEGSAMAADYQALSADHLEHATESNIKKMAAAGTVAVLLPGAIYFLQQGRKPPINLLRKHNVPIAIATDCNPGSSPTCSLLLMLNLSCVLLGLSPIEALAGVTKHAARALGMGDSHGSLTIGRVADFAIWHINHPHDLSYYFGYNPCVATVKEGEYSRLKK